MAADIFRSLENLYPRRHCERIAKQSTFKMKRKKVLKKNPSCFLLAKMDCRAIARNDGALVSCYSKDTMGGIQ